MMVNAQADAQEHTAPRSASRRPSRPTSTPDEDIESETYWSRSLPRVGMVGE
jgi:hypothetical protein